MKKLSLLLAVFMLAMSAFAADSPKREFRSTWLTSYCSIDWPSYSAKNNPTKSKQELIAYFDHHADRNFTGICIHARAACDANYASSIEPWGKELTGTRGKNPGWDPLAFAVEQCHARGLECYAWVNPFRFNYRISQDDRVTPNDLAIINKGWIINYGGKDVLNPALPEVRQYIINVIREIYTNYRVDGLLFDDYFYPNDIPWDSSAPDYQDFLDQNPGKQPTKKNIQDWRRGNINLFMRELYALIQTERPDMRFGVSPAGVAFLGSSDAGVTPPSVGSDWQYDGICSDPLAWLKDQSLDFISPQLYWATTPAANRWSPYAPYIPLATWWGDVATHFERHFYSSVAAYMFINDNGSPVYNNETNWADIGNQIETNREVVPQGTAGTITYSAKYMDGPVCSGWGDYLEEHQFQNHSLIPIVTWKEHPALTAPDVVRSGNNLTWTAPAQSGHDPIMRYTVYAIPKTVSKSEAADENGDGIKVQYLQRVVYGGSFQIPDALAQEYWFAVCAYDGYGYESAPAYIDQPDIHGIPCDPTEYAELGTLTMHNLWYRNVNAPFSNINFEEDGKLNRGMALSDGIIYLSNRNAAVNPTAVSLRTYDAVTGEFMGEHPLDIPTAGYACNDVITDNLGRIYVTNLVLNVSTAPVTVHRYNPEDGSCTLIAELKAPTAGRVDHCSIYADPSQPDKLTIFAAVASSANIYRWTVNGSQTDFASKAVTQFCPSEAANFGIAPRTFAIDDNNVVVDGGNTYIVRYNFSTGAMTKLIDGTDLTPKTYQANGYSQTEYKGQTLKLYPYADHQREGGYKFNLAGNDLLWQFPAIDFGSVNSTTHSAPVALGHDEEGNVLAAIYVPGNGLACYMVKSPITGVESVENAQQQLSVYGRTVMIPQGTESVRIYNAAGMLINSASSVSTVELPAAGMYIVVTDSTSHKVVVR